MKHLCCSKFLFILFVIVTSLSGSLKDKSAIVFYADHISYPTVGIHDYIIVQPQNIDTNTHGFSIYKDKMYAYVSILEVNKDTKEYKKIDPKWIIGENSSWNSAVLDIRNKDYQKFLFEEIIEIKIKEGHINFFFDTLDSYQMYAKTTEQSKEYEDALVEFISTFHKKFPHSKLVINRGFEIIERVHKFVEAVLFESYHYGINSKDLTYKKVSLEDKKWLDSYIDKIKSYGLDLIAVDYLPQNESDKIDESINIIKSRGMIPYVSIPKLDIYGKSSKNALKREILFLIDEGKKDRSVLGSHMYGALPLEYLGYIQELYEINQGLPKIENMGHYAGVVVWLEQPYKDPKSLTKWVTKLHSLGIKVVFIDNFGTFIKSTALDSLGIETIDAEESISDKKTIIFKDDMIGYEVQPPLSIGDRYLKPRDSKPLIIYEDEHKKQSVHAAITPWGGYALDEVAIIEINKENLWVINPFEFFRQALRLKPLAVPDTTTQNANRLLFSHIDGDGIMNRAEWNPELFSGDIILENILKVYKIPHTVSVIGAEINPEGLYPDISQKMINIAKRIYSLDNVEGATHTYTHPFSWGKIVDGNLDEEYRLKVKNYKFSLEREFKVSLDDISTKLQPPNKPRANIVFWSGSCDPREDVLKYIYKNRFLNINGGYTTITNTSPWLSNVAPIGLKRGDYYQIYTGAQNENVYTNNWLESFWGFKKVVQTFKLTDTPKRLKPIDIYYHLYSGSKRASLNALKYVFDWALEQDVFPIFTSEYIYNAMDYYVVSIANESDEWLVEGTKSLKTLRFEKPDLSVDIKNSKGVVGFKTIQNRTYIHLDESQKQLLTLKENAVNKKAYLIDANAKVTNYTTSDKEQIFSFSGHTDLKLSFYLPSNCTLKSSSQALTKKDKNKISLEYKNINKVNINVTCQ